MINDGSFTAFGLPWPNIQLSLYGQIHNDEGTTYAIDIGKHLIATLL